MRIIQKQPNQDGSYRQIFELDFTNAPDGCYQVTDGVELSCGGFGTLTVEDGIVTAFTPDVEAWEAWKATQPQPLSPLEQTRQDALSRIDGKCSGAIYSGVTVGDKHYKLTPTAQGNLKTALDKVASGATSVIYAADNEEPAPHTAAQITVINNAAYEWGVVNTTYYGKLQKWIARETNVDILNTIDYGIQLPDDLMQELGILLNNVGIDISKYVDKIVAN